MSKPKEIWTNVLGILGDMYKGLAYLPEATGTMALEFSKDVGRHVAKIMANPAPDARQAAKSFTNITGKFSQTLLSAVEPAANATMGAAQKLDLAGLGQIIVREMARAAAMTGSSAFRRPSVGPAPWAHKKPTGMS